MGKSKFDVGDEVASKRESDKKGVVIGYCKETGEYQVLLPDGRIHYESPRWLEKETSNQDSVEP